MTDLVEFLTAQYDRIEKTARAATDGPWRVGDVVSELGIADVYGPDGRVTSAYQEPCCSIEDAEHIATNDPTHVLADVESKRQIVREVLSWKHDVVEGDCWFTCGAATEERDGGECCNDNQRNECTCGLDERRMRILAPLAAPFSGEPGYKEDWAI